MQVAACRRLPDAGTEEQAGCTAFHLFNLDQIGGARDPAGILQQSAGIRSKEDVIFQEQGVGVPSVQKPLPGPGVAYSTRPMGPD